MKTHSFADRIDIAGTGTYPFRVYPLCYSESDRFSVSVDDSDYFVEDINKDLDKKITINMSENAACQLPFDGSNTNGYQLMYIPNENSPGDEKFSMGEYLNYDYDEYKYDWYGNCVWDSY